MTLALLLLGPLLLVILVFLAGIADTIPPER
jgi:hypothetical protein